MTIQLTPAPLAAPPRSPGPPQASSAPDPLLGGPRAPRPRTLVDVLAATCALHPDAVAIDDGAPLTYAELADAVGIQADRLAAIGVRRGDRVGVRIPSGTAELYLAILAVLHAGAAYVPVDAEDPADRARRTFEDAGVVAVVGAGLTVTRPDGGPAPVLARAERAQAPSPADDAWVIFTSGSTGRPKGVAVTHRSAAALVDSEARLFLPVAPLGPGDRVLAGLSVAFDASCEEMWLAWRHGATLVPAPRALVRSGADLGPWLVERDVTAVSTVPTLAGLWPAETVAGLRLLVFGGEAVPPDLVTRLARPGLEMWNTYGPTETTVVACGARLAPGEPVRIGYAIDGWDLAVVDPDGRPVPEGAVGELVVGGVGLARYLDPVLDAERFAPLPALGWDRAYRTGDHVRADREGLVFVGRTDEQVKVNGRRIELGEVDSALLALPGVDAAAAAVRRTPSGSAVLVGYVVPGPGVAAFDEAAAGAALRATLPAALVPVLAVVDQVPVRTSGKVDRDALPWPVPGASHGADPDIEGTAAWVAEQWSGVLGVSPAGRDANFFATGGSSLGAALLAAGLRERYPTLTVAEIYDHPTLGDLAAHLDATRADDATSAATPAAARARPVRPVPTAAQVVQLLALVPLRTAVALRWLTVLAAVNLVLHAGGVAGWAVAVPWWAVLAGWLVTVSPLGRMGLSALVARALLAGVRPGDHPRGGHVHLRIWAAQRFADGFGAITPTTAPWVHLYARALGARVGRDVDLHAVPPVTGMLRLGDGCAVEPEVDLTGCWVDGDVVHVGRVVIGPGARVGARSVLYPGARVGADADVAAGSAVTGTVTAGERWAGAPATRLGARVADGSDWPTARPPARRRSVGMLAFGAVGAWVALLPALAVATGLALVGRAVADTATLTEAVLPALTWGALGAVTAFAVYAALVAGSIRVLGRGLTPGCRPVRSGVGVRAWAVARLADAASGSLFPLYASVATPAWLRLLGARVGRGTEISTVMGIPPLMRVKDGSFLADDTLVAPYELSGGWLRVATSTVGTGAFLGNSGMAAPGRKVPKRGLVAVLSATPRRTRAGSSYLGSPPALVARTRVAADAARTHRPSTRLRVARAAVEALRLVPVVVAALLGLGVLLALQALVLAGGWGLAALAGGVVLLTAGAAGALVTVAAKWLLVGRYRAGEHPLWSAPVWRGELADTFTEVVAARYAADATAGSPALVWWLRAMGARIGRGVWCETYWLPEADLVRIGDGATIGPGCVVQTHLFHDRVMSLDAVTLGPGATLGPHSVALPAAEIGAGTTVGPGSLVLRGERLPAGSRWAGNPIAAWRTDPGPS